MGIKLPKNIRTFFYDDVYFIESQLEYELRLLNMEKEGYEVVFEPPRLPSSEIISMRIEQVEVHKEKGQRYFRDWDKESKD